MNLLHRLGAALVAMSGGGTYGPTDDHYYQPISPLSASGQKVTPDNATQISTVYTCLRVLGETFGSLPVHFYRRNGEDNERLSPDDLPPTLRGLPTLLGLAPAPNMTSFRFRETAMRHIGLRGNQYSRLRFGPDGVLQAFEMLHPDRVQPTVRDGSLYYVYQPPRGGPEALLPDEVLHIRGLCDNGLVGLSPITEQRETLGLALAASDYGARFFANDVRPSIHFKHPGKLGDVAYERLKKDLQTAWGGANRFKPALLEDGMDIARISITNEEAQFLETRKLSREEICAIYRVPQHLAGIMDRATFSNIEHQALAFVVYTIMPYCVRWEQEINAHPALLDGSSEFYVEFNVDGLLRGDLRSRYEAYAIGRNWGWLSANDVRRRERLNGIGAEGDEYLQPANMNRAGDVGGNPRQGEPNEPAPGGRAAALETERV